MTGDGTTMRGRTLILVVMCTAQFMCVLDDTVVNIALPAIQAGLGFSGPNLQWVLNGYLLTFGGLLLLAGRASGLFVRRTVFLAGLAVFGLASLACGLAVGPGMLVVSRAVQGVGAAFMSAAALAILTATFTGPARARAFGVWGGLSGLAGVTGVLLGGVLTGALGWRSVFLVNVVVVAVVAVLGARVIRADRCPARARLDPAGAVTVTAGTGLLIFGIVDSNRSGWGSPATVAALAAAVVLLAVFVAVERRHRHPLVPLAVFARRNVTGGAVCALLLASTMLGTFFFLSLYLQQVLGYRPVENGLAFLPFGFAVLAVATASARLIAHVGFKPLLAGGFGLLAVALLWLAHVGPHGGYLTDVFGPALLAGIGLGALLVGSVSATTHDLGDELGLASGLVTSTNQVGGALGLAVLSTVAFARTGTGPATPQSLLAGFGLAFTVAAGFAVLGLLVSVVVIANRSGQASQAQRIARH